ncbi:MAG: hypothetical protein P8O89_07345 [Polaribacter sp.]|nr:hypothetical protein [Polaribacter sp.]
MNTKIIMITSCIFIAALGISLSFLPDEILADFNITTNPILTVSMQLLGALYLGFAILNWMTKASLIGGIYNRPLAIGNFMHFAVGALALVKIINKIDNHSEIIISFTVVYSAFAILFGYVLITHPSSKKK